MPRLGAAEPIAALNRVRITERDRHWKEREPLVDMRYACPDILLARWICPYLRKSVGDMLNNAAASLPPGYKFHAGTALRTLSMQKHGWDGYFQRKREEHPEWPLSALRRAVNHFFAPYDQPAPPGHCTGGAVDVALIGPDGESVDVTSPTEGWQAAYTWSELISPEAKANRMIMVNAMLNAGFSNCRDEYWHYSYGDSAWAVRTNVHECPYGWIFPPVELEHFYAPAGTRLIYPESIRNDQGQVLSSEGSIPAELMQGEFRLGIYWSSEIPLVLHLPWPADKLLYLGDNNENWQQIDTPTGQDGIVRLEITPTADRIYLSDRPEAPAESKES